MSVEQAIRKMMTEQSAVNATLPLGQDACGDVARPKLGSSEDYEYDEQDENAPGTTTAKKIGQTTIQDQGDATTVRIQSMEGKMVNVSLKSIREAFGENASADADHEKSFASVSRSLETHKNEIKRAEANPPHPDHPFHKLDMYSLKSKYKDGSAGTGNHHDDTKESNIADDIHDHHSKIASRHEALNTYVEHAKKLHPTVNVENMKNEMLKTVKPLQAKRNSGPVIRAESIEHDYKPNDAKHQSSLQGYAHTLKMIDNTAPHKEHPFHNLDNDTLNDKTKPGSGSGKDQDVASDILKHRLKYHSPIQSMGNETITQIIKHSSNKTGVTPDKLWKQQSHHVADSLKYAGPEHRAAALTESYCSKDDISKLFAGQENLAEGFVEKAASIFEAAVIGRVNAEMMNVNEALEAQSEKELQMLKVALTEQVDLYMTEMVKVWAEENKIAIDTGLKQEVSESFINGLKDLFTEHYIEVPDGKVDVLESLTDELEISKKRINEAVNEKLTIQQELTDLKKQAVIAESTKGMTAIDADRLLALVEGVEFDSRYLYTEKVAVIKEQHFKKTAKKSAEMLLNESSGNDNHEHISTNVQRYVDALTRGKSVNIFTD